MYRRRRSCQRSRCSRGCTPKHEACTVAVADDIHYLRAVEVMARHDAVKAKLASEWIRRSSASTLPSTAPRRSA